MKKYFLFSLLAFSLLVHMAYADTPSSTSGIIPGQIWYSEDQILEGDIVKIYTAVWNSTKAPLSVKVEFYDKNVILGTRDLIVPSEKLVDVSVNWKVTLGDHVISAKIISSNLTTGKKDAVVLSSVSTKEDKKFIAKVIKNADGTITTIPDDSQSAVNNIGSQISDILPTSISTPVTNVFDAVDTTRLNVLNGVNISKSLTQKKIDSYNPPVVEQNPDTNINDKLPTTKPETVQDPAVTPQSSTDKPIAYLKLFFLSVLAFILGSKLVFYGLLLAMIFFLIRFIYRKIKNF